MDRNLKADVHILLEKQAGSEDCRMEIRTAEAWMLVQALALLIIKCAHHLGYSIEELIARLATVLLAPAENKGET